MILIVVFVHSVSADEVQVAQTRCSVVTDESREFYLAPENLPV
jgi:hypothetical protein